MHEALTEPEISKEDSSEVVAKENPAEGKEEIVTEQNTEPPEEAKEKKSDANEETTVEGKEATVEAAETQAV